jgi:hypothetical protein
VSAGNLPRHHHGKDIPLERLAFLLPRTPSQLHPAPDFVGSATTNCFASTTARIHARKKKSPEVDRAGEISSGPGSVRAICWRWSDRRTRADLVQGNDERSVRHALRRHFRCCRSQDGQTTRRRPAASTAPTVIPGGHMPSRITDLLRRTFSAGRMSRTGLIAGSAHVIGLLDRLEASAGRHRPKRTTEDAWGICHPTRSRIDGRVTRALRLPLGPPRPPLPGGPIFLADQ